MTGREPVNELDGRYSSEGAKATEWADARRHLESAQVSWLTTVRSDGRPHVTPLLSVWVDDALYFCTGAGERKARNLAQNAHCVLTTGCNALHEGLDVVVEGDAVRLEDEALLRRLAAAWESKYGPEWRFEVRNRAFFGDGGEALVYRVVPSKAFGFARGQYSQTRWRFS